MNYKSDIKDIKLQFVKRMDLFFLCWSFDSRWLFRIKNPCYELIFTIPFLINTVSLGWTYIQKSIEAQEHLPFLIQVIVIQALLAISNIYLICIVKWNSAEKLSKVTENYVTIENFYHDYQTKKVVWSKIGLIITVLSVILTFIQRLYINRNHDVYNCYANQFRYLIDLVSYGYILSNILVFLLFKLVYLFFAWLCCPGVYLRMKKIID